jgi:perosamine synthetase
VCNGTVALQAALSALELQPGDEVILPSFTIISCALAVIYAGGVPVFVDCTPDTWTLDPVQVAEAISPRTRAIMAVHIYGHSAEMDPLLALADHHGLHLIEDAAEAHGAEYLSSSGRAASGWQRCGSFGEMSTFSFYANKLITTGEGGMVLTDDDHLAARLRSLRDLCFMEPRFLHKQLGFNFRMTNLQAALGVAQMGRIERIVQDKRRMGRRYNERLGSIAGLQLPCEKAWAKNVYWMYGVVLDEQRGMDANQLAALLAAKGVQSRPFFHGMHCQPAFATALARIRPGVLGKRRPPAG